MDGWTDRRMDGQSHNLVQKDQSCVTKISNQIRSVAANKDQELNDKVELLQLLSLSWKTAISTSPLRCAQAMTMPCTSY